MENNLLHYDVVILGSGPAGLQAAIHAARAKVGVAVLGRPKKSSLYRAHVENYCCTARSTGEEILEQGRVQAKGFGVHLLEEDVLDLRKTVRGEFVVDLESGKKLMAWALILAMGISRNRLNVPGEKELLGRGVSYCVECDGNFFRNQSVAVVGNESAACSGALTMLLIAKEVRLIYEELRVNERLRYQVQKSTVIKHPGRKIREILGTQGVEGILLDNDQRIEVAGVFIELGSKGALDLAGRLDVALDPENMRYIAANKRQETNVPGVYAAGDICGPPFQMAKAVGEGCVAGLEAASYVKRVKSKSP